MSQSNALKKIQLSVYFYFLWISRTEIKIIITRWLDKNNVYCVVVCMFFFFIRPLKKLWNSILLCHDALVIVYSTVLNVREKIIRNENTCDSNRRKTTRTILILLWRTYRVKVIQNKNFSLIIITQNNMIWWCNTVFILEKNVHAYTT